MRVLVTGGSGFLGAWIIRRLLARGMECVSFDVRTNPRLVEALDRFSADGFPAFAKAYAARDALAGRLVRVQAAQGVHDGVAEGVDARGALCVRHGSARAVYDSADVSVRAA